jgi:hypothetical protein
MSRFSPRLLAFALFLAATPAPASDLRVGFGKADLTPDVDAAPVWIAGYGHNRKATGVHDKLWARAVALDDGSKKIALVSVDLVGLQRPSVEEVRKRLPGFAYVLIASTHNHEGPDVIGLWGPTERESGVDPSYLKLAEHRIVEAVEQAEAALTAAAASYGTAEDEELLKDARLPMAKDGVLRAVRFTRPGESKPMGLLVQWNCHPESLGSRNTLITADFPYATVKALEQEYGCPVAYFTGAVGGLMTNPVGPIKDEAGQVMKDGTYEYAEAYGEAVAALADRAIAGATPLALTPFAVSAAPVALPLANPGYRMARAAGVLPRRGFAWTGDPSKLGDPLPDRSVEGDLAIESEVAYLRLGNLHVAAIPGELYPELVYGQYEDPVQAGADFPDAPPEPPVMKSLPGEKTLLFGLANDEVGYIIPRRQWDDVPPFAYGRKEKQYGEVNSVGPDVAPILMNALRDRVREVEGDDR